MALNFVILVISIVNIKLSIALGTCLKPVNRIGTERIVIKQ